MTNTLQEHSVEPPLTKPTLASDPRLDPQTMQCVIALAYELQAKSRDTLSLAEAEAIAQELGIEGQFVRQAAQCLLSGSEPQQLPSANQSTSHNDSHEAATFHPSLFSRLPAQACLASVLTVVPTILFDAWTNNIGEDMLGALVVGACIGFTNKRKKSAAIVPAAVALTSVFTSSMTHHLSVASLGDLMMAFSGFGIAGGLGAFSGLSGYWLRGLRLRKKLQSRRTALLSK